MPTEITIKQMNKRVAVWSDRRARKITIEVDYQRVQDGNFTLLHITRLQDSIRPTTPESDSLLPIAA